jgi:hypothetical protein
VKQQTNAWLQKLGRIPTGWWVVVLTLPALAPLAHAGFFESHDGLFHAYRLAALDRAVRAGVLFPRWFPEFGFGYGQPVLNFYGPLSYYWGLPFTLLGADAALALKLVLATGLLASALGMYRFARLHLERGPALVAALLYAYLPYHLVDLYVRGAVAEFLAFVWFPLVLWAFHRLVLDTDKHRFTQIGLAAALLAALVLTHSLSAFLFAPVLAAYLLLLTWTSRNHKAKPPSHQDTKSPRKKGFVSWRLGGMFSCSTCKDFTDKRLLVRTRSPLLTSILALASALALALALTAFHWLPILTEAQYVGLGHGVSAGYENHLVSLSHLFDWSPAYPYTDEPGVAPTFPLGWFQVAILVAALVLPFRPHSGRWGSVFFLVVALLSVFMLTLWSLPVWKLFERGLAFLQYPWRFQSLTALATAFLAGALYEAASSKQQALRLHSGQAAGGLLPKLAACCLLLATGLWTLWRLPYTPTSPDLSVEAMWQWDRYYGQIGATWTGEYLPIWVTEQRWAISHPATEPATNDTVLPAGQFRLTGVGYNRYEFWQESPSLLYITPLVLHQFYYPGWEALEPYGEGLTYKPEPEGALGLAAFSVGQRSGSLPIRFEHTPARIWGSLLSLITALAVGVALVARYQLTNTRRPLSLAACYLLLAAVLLAHLALPNGYVRQVTQVNANLEDTAELLSFTTDRDTYHPGDTVRVTLYWRALRAPQQDYKTFVHLTDAALTRQPAQHDGDPGGGFTPTTRWLPGELVPDTHPVALPDDLPPGRYRLWAGMYEPEPLRNLAVLSSDTTTADNRVLLGEIEVLAP